MLVRRIARPLLGAPFIVLGFQALREPGGRVEIARPIVEKVTEVADKQLPVQVPRDPEQCTSPLFLATRKHLEALIHRDRPVVADKLPAVRMTVVGDDVE